MFFVFRSGENKPCCLLNVVFSVLFFLSDREKRLFFFFPFFSFRFSSLEMNRSSPNPTNPTSIHFNVKEFWPVILIQFNGKPNDNDFQLYLALFRQLMADLKNAFVSNPQMPKVSLWFQTTGEEGGLSLGQATDQLAFLREYREFLQTILQQTVVVCKSDSLRFFIQNFILAPLKPKTLVQLVNSETEARKLLFGAV